MVTWSFRDLDRVAAADLLHPDVEFPTAIGAVSNEAPIRRPRRSDLQAVAKRDACQSSLPRRRGSMAFLVDKKSYTGQQRQGAEQKCSAQNPPSAWCSGFGPRDRGRLNAIARSIYRRHESVAAAAERFPQKRAPPAAATHPPTVMCCLVHNVA